MAQTEVKTGVLQIEGAHLLLIVYGEEERIEIQPDASLEIHLGGHWVPGTFAPDYDDEGKLATNFELLCADRSFCGLHTGMMARIFKGMV